MRGDVIYDSDPGRRYGNRMGREYGTGTAGAVGHGALGTLDNRQQSAGCGRSHTHASEGGPGEREHADRRTYAQGEMDSRGQGGVSAGRLMSWAAGGRT